MYIIYTPNIGSEIAVFDREREQGHTAKMVIEELQEH